MEMIPVDLKSLKVAMSAHNSRKRDASYNEHFNADHKLGSFSARNICRMIAVSTCGNGTAKITMKDAIRWAQGMLPVGMGYKSQDIQPWFEGVVALLRNDGKRKERENERAA